MQGVIAKAAIRRSSSPALQRAICWTGLGMNWNACVSLLGGGGELVKNAPRIAVLPCYLKKIPLRFISRA